MTVSVSFPVEAHVRKYLIRRYGSAHIVSTRSLLGTQVIDALQKTFERPDTLVKSVHKYTVLVPEGYIVRFGVNLCRNTEQHLGQMCKHLFEEAMLEHLDLAVLDGKKVMTSLREWLSIFKINEDDAKLESLYKTWQRHAKDKLPVDVPTKPLSRNRRQRKKKGK